MDAAAITSDCTLERAYAEGRSDEREQWLPLAGELRARILHKHQTGGTVRFVPQGVTQNVVANYTVTDQHGATDTSTLTITLTGTNDDPSR